MVLDTGENNLHLVISSPIGTVCLDIIIGSINLHRKRDFRHFHWICLHKIRILSYYLRYFEHIVTLSILQAHRAVWANFPLYIYLRYTLMSYNICECVTFHAHKRRGLPLLSGEHRSGGQYLKSRSSKTKTRRPTLLRPRAMT